MHYLPKASPLPQKEAAHFYAVPDSDSHETSADLRDAKLAVSGRLTGSCGSSQLPQLAPATGPQLAWPEAHTAPAAGPDAPLPAAELSVRTYNALRKGRITTIRQFCVLELGDLRWLRSFGEKAVAEVIAYRGRLGVPMKRHA